MVRAPCCDKQGLKKGPWTPEEDKLLVDYIQSNGHGSWRNLPKLAGLLRCGKSCRLRWTNYLRPDIKRGPFTPEEEKSIIQLHGIVGNKWSIIAGQLPGRTDNEIKNYWNTHLKKRLLRMGINPDTFSCTIIAGCAASTASTSSSTRHMAQWENARLEAEARLSRESLLSTTTNNVTAADSSVDDHQPPKPVKTEAVDFFLKIWNSEIGEAFRKESSAVTKEEEEMVESKSCITAIELPQSKVADESSTYCDELVDTSAEAYQMYLDFAADDELCLFGGGGVGGFASYFSGDMQEVNW